MSKFTFQTDDEHRPYLYEIAEAMSVFFGLRREEAIARINDHWGDIGFLDSDMIFHETPQYWAQWIFYGKDFWRSIDHTAAASLLRIERKLNFILDHLGIDHNGVSSTVVFLVQQGKKFEAIHLYQREVGGPLRKAKEVIEQLQSRLAEEEYRKSSNAADQKAQQEEDK